MPKIGLIGYGRWGRHILRDLKALGCSVVVAEPCESSRARAIGAGADEAVRDLGEIARVDGMVVAATTARHADIVLSLLERGCPIYCEKPLTDDPESARLIVERGHDHVFVMHKWVYHPGIAQLREIARSGRLGQVQGMRTRRLGWGNPHQDVDISWILLPHDLSIALEVLGQLPPPVRAFAERNASGLATLSSWHEGDVWLECEVSARSPEHLRSIELRCQHGVARLGDAYDTHVAILHTDGCLAGGAPPEWERIDIPDTMPLHAELEAFVRYVAGQGPAPRSSAAEGLAVVRAIAGIRELAGLPAAVREG